jgi:hypothetical protein
MLRRCRAARPNKKSSYFERRASMYDCVIHTVILKYGMSDTPGGAKPTKTKPTTTIPRTRQIGLRLRCRRRATPLLAFELLLRRGPLAVRRLAMLLLLVHVARSQIVGVETEFFGKKS